MFQFGTRITVGLFVEEHESIQTTHAFLKLEVMILFNHAQVQKAAK